MSSLFLDVEGAAEFLKVKPATIYAWVFHRRIPFRKHGRRVVFFREDLEKWSQSQAVGVHSNSPFEDARNCDKQPLTIFENQAHREREPSSPS